MQYPLNHCNYEFLKYDSSLCATDIQKVPIKTPAKTIEDGKTPHVGNLTADDLAAVIAACRDSKPFRNSDNRKFFY